MQRTRGYTATYVAERSYETKRPTISSPEDAVEVFRASEALEPFEQERFYSVLLDTRNHVRSVQLIAQGTLDGALVHPRDVFREAVRSNAAKLIIVHSHPSGDTTPSQQDIEFTRRIDRAGELLGISLIDHVVIGPEYVFTSFKARGLI